MARSALVGAACCVALALGACTERPPELAARGEEARPARRTGAAPREVTRPRRPRVENSTAGATRRLIARAVSDLRSLGLWRRLTRHLYRVYLGARDGAVNIPDDGHLADSLLTAAIDAQGSGALCDIRFYPAAIARDLARQREFHATGRLPRRPPTLRQFWVALLAHELAHCLPHPDPQHQVGEPAARRWEERVLRAARAGLPGARQPPRSK